MIAQVELLAPDWAAVDAKVTELLRPQIDYAAFKSVGTERALFVSELREKKLWPASERDFPEEVAA